MALSMCGKRFLLTRTSFLACTKRHGYIILVPEIGEDSPDKNPLVKSDGLPEFNNLTIENCMASIAKQTLDFESGVEQIEKNLTKQPSADLFKDVFEPLEEIGSNLDLTWGISKTLYLGNSSLMPTKSYLSIHDRAKRARSTKYNSPVIYEAIEKELCDNKERSPEQTRVLKKFTLEGRLNGLNLSETQRKLLDEYLNKLSSERASFKNKIEIATKQFSHALQDAQLTRDFPPELLQAMSPNPDKYLNGPWIVTLQPNVYTQVLERCPEREVRWNVWQALVTRGSSYNNQDLITSAHLEGIRYARHDIAKLLGFASYADMSMETKMAGGVENVKNMLTMLVERAKPAEEQELENLHSFALERGFKCDRLQLWDVPYWRSKQLKTLYDYDEGALKQYFPLPKVLEGLFQLCETLFNITIKQRSDVSTWHKDVKFYDVFEQHSSAPVAGFYLDAYARRNEKNRTQNNSWMVGIQNQSRITGAKPLAALIFNFEHPTNERPSFLTFKEVTTLFHKFGQSLQHLLTRTTYSEVSGLSNIEWDAVEVCGHVLTHWLYDKTTIDNISSHCASEDKLPQKIFDSLVNVRRHMAGLDLTRELYLSALDLELHSSGQFWLEIVKNLWPVYRSFPLDKLDSHPCSFTQIFCEEWGAAYYSHVWSRMVAADVYSAFHEVRDDPRQMLDVGKRYRDTFLALGGGAHPSQVFRQFRGRDPSPKALLSSLGLKKVTAEKQH